MTMLRSNAAGKLASSLLLLPVLGWMPASQAAINFVFDYSGNAAGVGFLDPTYGTARQNALATAGNNFSNLFGQYFTNSGTIAMKVTSSQSTSDNTLASAGSELVDTGSNGFTLGEVIRSKLQTGSDLNGSTADGLVDVNFGNKWQLDPDVTPDKSANEYDFYSTMYHEFLHALGFSSSFDEAGAPLFGDKTNGGAYSAFDSFIVDSNGNNLIAPNGTVANQAALDAAVIGGPNNGAFFNGANAKAANGGNAVGLYTPNPYENGSSVSHLDDENPALAGLMMLAATEAGPSARTFSSIEVGILKDIGYAPVPLPAAFWLFASAIAVLFGFGRRNNSSGAAATVAA